MGNSVAPLAPQLKIGSVLRENKTGRQGVVVGFDPKNPQAPIVKFYAPTVSGSPVTAPTPPKPSTPMEQWSEMLLHEVQSPGPKFEAPAPNLSPYARAIEESAELSGESQAAATRQKQIEDAMKSLGGISKAELEESQGESFSSKAKRENLVNTILGRLMEGNLSGEQQDAMLKLLSYAEGKFPTGTDWQVVSHPGMGVYRVNRITGKSVPVLGPNGRQITVPRRESSMDSPAHNAVQANMAGRQTLSQLGAAINGVLPDYMGALQKQGVQIPQAYPANVNFILEHPQYWNLLPAIKDMIGQAYNDLAVDVAEFGVNLPKTDDTAEQLHFIRAMARRGGAAEIGNNIPASPEPPKTIMELSGESGFPTAPRAPVKSPAFFNAPVGNKSTKRSPGDTESARRVLRSFGIE